MDDSAEGSIPRRDALRKMAVVTVAAAATSIASAVPKTRASRGQGVLVFRLRTRDTRTCRACKIHHRYLIFASRALAETNRPHPNCNCPVTMQKLPKEEFRRIFLDTGAIRFGFVDLRKLGTEVGTGEGSRRGKRAERHAVGGTRTA